MLDIKFKPCCDVCANRDTYITEDKLYSDNRVFDVMTIIGCKHEQVCKEYRYIKKEGTSQMTPELKKGQKISVTLYIGKSKIEATSLYEYLENNRRKQLPIPLSGSEFNIIIESVIDTETPDIHSFGDVSTYKVEMKGELL